ncbi:hypothetical protein [Mycolicibacterium alvei]|uniref:hypothetical protein n=1 Tax=Mycolicibacterium alvei TaxID=67081 RepID=UPI0013CFBD2E|nr:hypothetical protein [Mycolicibacterium alvei]MCV6999340.1 hypothetical protein [Mycolicibacterium alvei]
MAAAGRSARDVDQVDTVSQSMVVGAGSVATKCVRQQSGQGHVLQVGRVDRSDELGVHTSIG